MNVPPSTSFKKEVEDKKREAIYMKDPVFSWQFQHAKDDFR